MPRVTTLDRPGDATHPSPYSDHGASPGPNGHLDSALWTGAVDHPDVAYEDDPHIDDVVTGSFAQRLYRR